MSRLLLTILFLISTIAVVMHGVMVYKVSDTFSFVAEEEAPDEQTVLKETKDFSNEKFTSAFALFRNCDEATMNKTLLNRAFHVSKGFYDTPYNPPDNI